MLIKYYTPKNSQLYINAFACPPQGSVLNLCFGQLLPMCQVTYISGALAAPREAVHEAALLALGKDGSLCLKVTKDYSFDKHNRVYMSVLNFDVFIAMFDPGASLLVRFAALETLAAAVPIWEDASQKAHASGIMPAVSQLGLQPLIGCAFVEVLQRATHMWGLTYANTETIINSCPSSPYYWSEGEGESRLCRLDNQTLVAKVRMAYCHTMPHCVDHAAAADLATTVDGPWVYDIEEHTLGSLGEHPGVFAGRIAATLGKRTQ